VRDKNFTIKKDESGDNLIPEINVNLFLNDDLGEFLEETKVKYFKKHS
jgi:hypothetical protein